MPVLVLHPCPQVAEAEDLFSRLCRRVQAEERCQGYRGEGEETGHSTKEQSQDHAEQPLPELLAAEGRVAGPGFSEEAGGMRIRNDIPELPDIVVRRCEECGAPYLYKRNTNQPVHVDCPRARRAA